MDFKLSDEQELIVASYRDYMESENWETYFHECDGSMSIRCAGRKACASSASTRSCFPRSMADWASAAAGSPLMAISRLLGQYGAPTLCALPAPGFGTIVREGTQERIDAVMATLGTGEQMSTPPAPSRRGSDVSGLQTTYKRENGKIYLNGTKTFITSSLGVKYLIIMCRDADNPDVISEFFVDMSKPGIKLSPLTKLGLRMDSCCRGLPRQRRDRGERTSSAKEGNGFNRGVSDFNFERWLVGACDYGTAISAFEDAAKHAWTRIAFGKPVARFQLNSLKFAHMAIKLDSMRNMLYGSRLGMPTTISAATWTLAALQCAKYYCANASFEVVDDAMQVMGGIAVASEHRINRIWRDLRVDRVSGGTDEMMILTASKNAIKPYRQ